MTARLVAQNPVLSENHIRTYWWCSPAKIGIATMTPDRTARPRGPSACARDCNTLHTKQELAAGAAAQSKTRWRAPQGDAELMTEKQVLGLKQAPRLEQVGDEHHEQVQDRKHRPG